MRAKSNFNIYVLFSVPATCTLRNVYESRVGFIGRYSRRATLGLHSQNCPILFQISILKLLSLIWYTSVGIKYIKHYLLENKYKTSEFSTIFGKIVPFLKFCGKKNEKFTEISKFSNPCLASDLFFLWRQSESLQLYSHMQQ